MRPKSVVPDLQEAIAQALHDASCCGLDLPQIMSVAKKELATFEREWRFEARERAGDNGQ